MPETNERLAIVENSIIRMETSIKTMADSIKELAVTISDHKVVTDRTMRNTESIIELRDQLAKSSSSASSTCATTHTTTIEALNAFREELESMDTKIDVRGDSRLKWGLTTAVTINFTTISIVIGIIYTLYSSTTNNYKDLSENVREIKEIVIINRENINNAQKSTDYLRSYVERKTANDKK